jgi:SAM-dependent methyltransferase
VSASAPERPGDYVGGELELFADARNWKAYWSERLRPYLGKDVLDVGAGLGATAQLLAARTPGRYVALEPDAALADRIRADVASGVLPPGVEVRTGTLQSLDPEPRFDTVLYIDVLEHIEDDVAELRQAAARLRPGGRLIVLAPAHQSLFSPFDAAIGHHRRYDRRSLGALRPEGLALERMFYLDSAGLLASAANRLLLRASLPTPAQIRLWDRRLVPVSRVLDPVLAHRAGKTVVAVFRRPEAA